MNDMENFIAALKAFEEEFGCSVVMHAYTEDLKKIFAFIFGIHTNPYCSVLKKKVWDTVNPLCRYFDCVLCGEILNGKDLPFYKYCHCSVLELVVPVLIEKRVAGVLYIGPFNVLKEALPPDTLLSKTFIRGLEKFNPQKEQLAGLSARRALRLKKISLLLSTMMSYIAEKSKEAKSEGGGRKERIENFIRNNFRKDASLQALAAHLLLSESRTTQIVKEYFDKSLPALVTEQKINCAKTLLVSSYFSASAIAVQSGFSEPGYFFKTFKKYTGFTPAAYRKKNRKENISF
jgi:AraC-like DNA-binding protein